MPNSSIVDVGVGAEREQDPKKIAGKNGRKFETPGKSFTPPEAMPNVWCYIFCSQYAASENNRSPDLRISGTRTPLRHHWARTVGFPWKNPYHGGRVLGRDLGVDYGCSTVVLRFDDLLRVFLVCFTWPAMTVVTVASRALDRARESSALFYGCFAVVLTGFICPAMTVATVASRALDGVRERALGCFARSPKSPPARRCVMSPTCHRVP